MYDGNIRKQEIFRKFPKIREIHENFLHAKICCSAVVNMDSLHHLYNSIGECINVLDNLESKIVCTFHV